MLKTRKCSYCGKEIDPGCGMLFVQRTGSVLQFCSNKCKKSQLYMKRDPKKLKWTERYERKIM
ncbi:MAG: 50S ribosomal protein L24e [Candidatus Heimdallarchaeota archaeon]|nr:50S ribosomal protein L24e [Candidatus Heimdallarchaeota archaeon]MCK4954244.1 50S ribosomal protein L24e [Candidatus Heimdallarchaeota archaeon]